MVKTITNCNVGWPSTVRMNRLLVDRVGEGRVPNAGGGSPGLDAVSPAEELVQGRLPR